MARGTKRKRTEEPAQAPASEPAAPDAALVAFSDLIARRAEVFAGLGEGKQVSEEALQVVKKLFDQSLTAEPDFLERAGELLSQLTDFGIQTRSRSKRRKAKSKQPASDNPLLQATPLSELVTQDMQDEQIWEQLDMRASKVNALVSQLMSGGTETPSALDADEVEKMEVDEVEGAGLDEPDPADNSDDSDYDEFGLDDGAAAEGPSDEELSDAEISFTALNDSKRTSARSKRLALDELDDGPSSSPQKAAKRGAASPVDDQFFSLDAFLRESEQGEVEMRRALKGSAEDDEDADPEDDIDYFADVGGAGDMDEDGEDEEIDLGDTGDIGYADFFDPPPKPAAKKPRSSLSKPGKKASLDDADASMSSNRRVSFSEKVMVKPIAARKNTTSFAAIAQRQGLNGALKMLGGDDEDDEDFDLEAEEGDEASLSDQLEDGNSVEAPGGYEEEEEEDSEEEELDDEGEELDAEAEEGDDSSQEAIEDLKDDLFADADDNASETDENADGESRYERRLKALRKQIAELEAENVADREWTMKGEASSRQRPLNSLLEQDLEFENVSKVVPLVTAEVTASLEERIKKRIIDDNFDDVVRRRAFDPAAYLPSRLLDISATQSDKSLADLYADEFSTERQKAEGQDVVHPADARLEKEHKEIEKLYDDLCAKLDALSNARFTPKAPETVISTVSNVGAVSLESALPASQSATTLLAPEEVYAPKRGLTEGAAKQELTPAEKKAARQRKKRHLAGQAKQVDRLSGGKQKPQSAKAQKEQAITKLVGTKGVSVIGKPSAAAAKKGKAVQQAQSSVEKRGSAALKL